MILPSNLLNELNDILLKNYGLSLKQEQLKSLGNFLVNYYAVLMEASNE